MQGKIKTLITGLVLIFLTFGSSISNTHAEEWTRQTCYSLALVMDGGMGLPPAASPSNCEGGKYIAGTVVQLAAQPDPGFTVAAWRGTNDEPTTALDNTVTLTADKEVGILYSPTDVSSQVLGQVPASGAAKVIILLQDPVSIQATGEMRAAAVAQVQASVLAELLPAGFELTHQYSHVPALAGRLDADALEALRNNPLVASVEIDGIVHATMNVSVPAIHADDVHAMGITGDGVTVAVLDTGIDTNHPDLQDDLVAQKCFNQGDCPPGNSNQSSNAEDEDGHGTNVSGIITSNGTVAPLGFAPDAKIVAVRVLDSNGSGTFSDILAGLNWIIANQGTLGVDVVNMSLGGDTFPGNCDAVSPSLAKAFKQLNALGIVNFVASGNNGEPNRISIPACLSNVISVGAVYDSNMGREPDAPFVYGGSGCYDATTAFGKIACFSNASNQLDILAPGARITSAGIGGGTSVMFGTSQASPTAAGVAALMLEANSSLTPAQIESILESTGVLTTDSRNGLKFPRIDAYEAVSSIIVPVLTRPANGASTRDTTPTFVWQSVSGATRYQLQVDDNNNFASPVINLTRTSRSYIPSTALSNGSYYWRVRAQSGGTWGNWSTRWVFTVDTTPPARPVLISPANGGSTSDSTPTLRWGAVGDAARYTVQVDNNADFSSPVFSRNSTTNVYTPRGALATGRYYWRVRAIDEAGNVGSWSTRWSFRVTGGALAPLAETQTPPTPVPTDRPTHEPTETPVEVIVEFPTLTPTEIVTDPLLRVESDQPVVHQTGVWTSHVTEVASGGSYLYSSGSFEDGLSLTFEGTQVEVIYVKHPALGTFALEIDGTVAQLVDSVAAASEFGAQTRVSGLADGPHTLRIYPVAGVVALDAFGVEALAEVPTPTPTDVPTDQPTDVPPDQPTLMPTATSTPLPVTLPFIETFDNGLGWVPTGAWVVDTQTAHQGASWFAESMTRNQSSTLTFGAALDLRAALNPEVSFWQKMSLTSTDLFALDVSLDGGLTWQPVDQQIGQVLDWTPRVLDLTAYRGQVIALRFRLDTLNVLPEDVVTLGVWVDDLVIQEALPTPTPTGVPPATDQPTSTLVPPTATDLPTSTPVPTDTPTDIPTATPLPTDTPTEVPTQVPTDIPVPTEVPAEAPAAESTEESAS